MAAIFHNLKGYRKCKYNLFISDDSAILLPNLRGFGPKLTEIDVVV